MDITQLIADDHEQQRRLFAQIEQIPAEEKDALAAIWNRLRALLDTHAEAEERFFYPDLLKLGEGGGDADSAEEETEDAIKDHNEIRDAGEAVDRCDVGSKQWFDAVGEANKANADHMGEEERQGLTDFRQHAPLDLRHQLAIRFAAFGAANLTGVKPVDKDPAGYIAKNS